MEVGEYQLFRKLKHEEKRHLQMGTNCFAFNRVLRKADNAWISQFQLSSSEHKKDDRNEFTRIL